MSVGTGPCVMCIQHAQAIQGLPRFTTTELVERGLSPSRDLCDDHRVAWDAASRALNDAYRNSKGSFA